MLIDRGKLRAGETVLVNSASSGVSMAAIQICKLAGAYVYTTSSADWKLERAKELGADEVINYNEVDFVDEILRRTSKRGVDLVVEHVGGDFLDKSIRCLTRGGRVVTVGGTKSYDCNVPVNYIFHKELAIIGSNSATKHDLEVMMPLLGEGKLQHRDRSRVPAAGSGGSPSLSRIGQAVRQGAPACRALTSRDADCARRAAQGARGLVRAGGKVLPARARHPRAAGPRGARAGAGRGGRRGDRAAGGRQGGRAQAHAQVRRRRRDLSARSRPQRRKPPAGPSRSASRTRGSARDSWSRPIGRRSPNGFWRCASTRTSAPPSCSASAASMSTSCGRSRSGWRRCSDHDIDALISEQPATRILDGARGEAAGEPRGAQGRDPAPVRSWRSIRRSQPECPRSRSIRSTVTAEGVLALDALIVLRS